MSEQQQQAVTLKERISAHLAIARLDHSIKNLFVLPGVIIPLSIYPELVNRALAVKLVLAFISITLVACSNYVINEVLDAPFDRLHPTKKNRAAARGHVNIGVAYVQWIVMMLVGVAIGLLVGKMFALTAAFLWVMGCFYNIPPARTKDVPYLDVLTESINNPLRMLLGWYAVTSVMTPPDSLVPPVSLRAQRDRRPFGGGLLSRQLQALYAGVAAGLGGLLRLHGDALLRRVHHPLPHRADPGLPSGGLDDGDLLQAGVQGGELRAEPREALQGAAADGRVYGDRGGDGSAVVHPAAKAGEHLCANAAGGDHGSSDRAAVTVPQTNRRAI
jgi:hypothetical protein